MTERVLRRTLTRHVLLTVLVAVVLSGITAFGVWRYTQDEARRTAEKVARQIASAVQVPLAQRDFGRAGGFGRDALLSDLSPVLRSGMIERVKVFTVDGTAARIVFSDEERIEGHEGTLRPELAAELDRGEVVVQSVPEDPEHAYERGLPGERLEVYFGFRDVGGNDTRLEVYVPVSMATATRSAVAALLPLVLGGLLLVALATLPLSVALARRVERDRAERRAARDYGLAAADLTRRDLAQYLHDGVIPDLAGASMLLEAVHSQSPRDSSWELVGHAQGLVADDIRRLRALLEDLVPVATATEPEIALTDLAARVVRTAQGEVPAVLVEVVPEVSLTPHAGTVVHQVAGELLRNAVAHAGASCVRLLLAPDARDAVELTVTDDGVGFDPSRPRRTGHIGLELVRQVVAECGGRMAIESTMDSGTVVRVGIPARVVQAGEPGPGLRGPARPGRRAGARSSRR